jgi:spore coat protein U-like protein
VQTLTASAISGAFLILGLAAARPSLAQPGLASCTLVVPELVFGDYDFLDASPTRSTARITIHCIGKSTRLGPRIELSAGASQDFARRTQVSGSDVLTYNIYIDQALTQVAGDGSGGTVPLFFAPNETGAGQKVDLYGAVDPKQLAPPGSYSDTVYVTIIF